MDAFDRVKALICLNKARVQWVVRLSTGRHEAVRVEPEMELDSNLSRAIEQVRTSFRRQPKLPVVKAFFDEPTFTATYVHDPATRNAAIIDSVLDFDQPSGRTSFESADAIVDYVRERTD